ncbi:MAG: hypothetical protein ABSD89_06445 [Halobacteriota archaeon]|jgi:hypothetical protein
MLRDIPRFVGTDGKNYTLKEDELAFLPHAIARALAARKLAEID